MSGILPRNVRYTLYSRYVHKKLSGTELSIYMTVAVVAGITQEA